MPGKRFCHRHGDRPCSCEMGNLYRFVEPIVLLSLARLGVAHGYQIARETEELAVTHAGVDAPAIYRTLRRLEELGYVRSAWNNEPPGPARREYSLTADGREHLRSWTIVLKDLQQSLDRLVKLSESVADDQCNN